MAEYGLLLLVGEHRCQPSIECCRSFAIRLPTLLLLMSLVHSGQGKLGVGGGMGVENPDIKERTLVSTSPD